MLKGDNRQELPRHGKGDGGEGGWWGTRRVKTAGARSLGAGGGRGARSSPGLASCPRRPT